MNLDFFKKHIRINFGKFSNNNSIPDLIKIQKKSYENFLQFSVKKNERKNQGLENIFRNTLNLKNYDNNLYIKYKGYKLKLPKYTPQECIQRGVNYSAALKLNIELILHEDNNSKIIKKMKNHEIYLGDIPMMTNNGTFIINGAQRVIVSQLHRSPGVFYFKNKSKNSSINKDIFCARIIPYKGCWLDFEIDNKNVIYFRIDRKKKMPITTLYMAIGYNIEDILRIFYNIENINYKDGFFFSEIDKNIEHKKVSELYINNNIIGKDIIIARNDKKILHRAGEKITEIVIKNIKKFKIQKIEIINIKEKNPEDLIILKTIKIDKNNNKEESIRDIYKTLSKENHVNKRTIEENFKNMIFNPFRYDLSTIGRIKINKKHKIRVNNNVKTLTKIDIIAISKHLINIKKKIEKIDDIDSLSNRRVKTVGELVGNQFKMGTMKMQKSILDKISSTEIDYIMSHDIMNTKILTNYLREFFCLSQLSQFMDQTNPLSEITHKRRLSALGPGGVTRERAGFEVRDVHFSHYSRICPIETPEGQNIGLISSLAMYADIDKYGFIISPYKEVKNGYITNKIVYITAIEEENLYIAKANLKKDENNKILENIITCHKNGEIVKINRDKVNLIDISPQQIVSVAAALIPFLENNDANRALMGSNMQRQAVPLLVSESPLIGTGIEEVVARDSGNNIIAKRTGIIEKVDSEKIIVKTNKKYAKNRSNKEDFGIDIYQITKYMRSNQGTCINQIPIVKLGQVVNSGDIIADGPASDGGELALGKNILVAFMPWNGYNFEDSILISNKLVIDDIFTSVHINEYEIISRDTRLGREEITREIPNASEKELKMLDSNGIINIGSDVKHGDILVGKTTPKNETILTPEEKLLRAIFGEKSNNLKNSSLKVPSGEKGKVMDLKIFTKRDTMRNMRAIIIEKDEIKNIMKEKKDEIKITRKYIIHQINKLIKNNNIKINNNEKYLSIKKLFYINCVNKSKNFKLRNYIKRLINFYINYKKNIEYLFNKRIEKLRGGDDLPQGVLQIIKVYTANKVKIQAGDKMAGRHGNKGVVSKIAEIEEMPYLENGKYIDIVLNPLGVPSRMNIGQILETHMGLISSIIGKKIYNMINKSILNKDRDYIKFKTEINNEFNDERINKIFILLKKLNLEETKLLCKDIKNGIKISTPVFDGIKEETMNKLFKKINRNNSGQIKLRDGKTGEFFDRKITVGYVYMLKLDHLIDNKMHARSIGPYSLVTQQPLGGKSHCGGQRFGEMECWALQAYGAAYTLREMLTVKSDDVIGRVKAYESIIKNENSFEIGLPESFKVMIKEIRSLGLNIEMIEK